MKITLLLLGKNKDDYIEKAVLDFIQKLKPLCKLEIKYLKDEKIHTEIEKILNIEAEKINSTLQPKSYLIVLDEKGKQMSSNAFSRHLQQRANQGNGHFTFIIGSAHGLSDEIKQKADLLLSLSSFTTTHQLARVILLEQIYRVFTILRGMKYHK